METNFFLLDFANVECGLAKILCRPEFPYTCSYVTNSVSQLLEPVSLSDSGFPIKISLWITSSNVYLVIFLVLLGQSDIVAKLCEFGFKVVPASFLDFADYIQISKFFIALIRQHAIYAFQQRIPNGNLCIPPTSAQLDTIKGKPPRMYQLEVLYICVHPNIWMIIGIIDVHIQQPRDFSNKVG